MSTHGINTKEKKAYITDTILRDAHQCLLATRMRTEDMIGAAKMLDEVGYWSLEAWGGATFDTCLRFLKEDPWERLKTLRKAIPNTRLQMLLRGQNLVGYRHYADDIVEAFVKRSAANGIDVFRVFDALNDLRNLEVAIRTAKECDKIVEGCISYTTSPFHTHERFIEKALKLVDMGSDIICIKDMAGLMTPYSGYDLISKLRSKTDVPIHIHTHDSSGLGDMTYMKCIEAGANIVDLAISSISSGAAQPATESMVASFQGTEYDTGLDLGKLAEIAEYFKEVRKKYAKYESEFTKIDPKTLIVQVPGGMISNMANQLKEQNALDRMNEVFDEIPRVREDMGFPPLVTPSSQIVGTQATLNVLTGERYKVITSETRNYFKGLYGQPPGEMNKEAKKSAIGDDETITCRPADLLEPELDKVTEEIKNKTSSIEDILSYALFPAVALEFFEEREAGTLEPESLDLPEETGVGTEGGHNFAPSEFNVTVHGETYKVKVMGAGHKVEGTRPFFIKVDGKMEEVMLESLTEIIPATAGELQGDSTQTSTRPKATKEGDITTSMPGKITSIKVSVGAEVAEGDTVLTMEAMKMESELHSPISGIVKRILVKVGDQVNPDETLVEIEEE